MWVGVGVVAAAIAGIVALGESASLTKLFFLALMVVGVDGLRLAEA